MTALLTQCPHCQTSFRVSAAQMQAAHGLVRCGSCLGVFSASANEIRVKHPDGYVVEELEDTDENEDELEQPFIPEPDLTTPTSDFDEIKAVGDSPGIFAHPLFTPVEETPTDDFSPGQTDDFVSDAPWKNKDELNIPLGDLRLDELDDYEYDDDEPAGEWPEEPEPTPIPAEVSPFDSVPDEATDPFLEDETDPFLDDETDPDIGLEPEMEAALPATHAVIRDTSVPVSKQHVHAGLSGLNPDDALAPLSDGQLLSLDEVPLSLAASTGIRSRMAQAMLLLANLLLLLALPLPWLYTHRDELASDPRFGFLAPYVCRYMACAPPVATPAPGTMYSQQLLVRSHPTQASALEVSFVFHNDSPQPQPFPGLELDFSDVNNHLLANRLFTPQEYLPPELRQLALMPARSSVQVQLELVDPGKEAVNYKVVLH